MNWLIEKVLFSMGKSQLMKLVWKLFRKIFKRIYWDMVELVKQAEQELPDADGIEKARVVMKRFKLSHDEVSEWAWLGNVLMEIAVGEVKKYEAEL
jgi:hypothetical protein